MIQATTTGSDPDPDGYSAAVDGGAPLTLADNGADTLRSNAGAHNVTLTGIAPNCTLSGSNPRPIDLSSGGTSSLDFDIACTAIPPTPGSITVGITTSGDSLNADGYAVVIDGGPPQAAPIQGVQQFVVPAGNHQVVLADVAANCSVSPADTLQVVVESGATIEADFTVGCSAPPAAPGRDLAVASNREIYLLSADGSRFVDLTNDPANDSRPAWSPDGTKIAFYSARTGTGHVFVMNADGTGVTRLTNGNFEGDPSWSPDGTMIAFDNGQHILLIKPDGSQLTQLTNGPFEVGPRWSPDGTKIAFTGGLTDLDVFVMRSDGSGITKLTTGHEDGEPSWSPDGSKIVFQSGRSGNMQVHTMNADGTGVTQLTFDTDGELDRFPVWSPDGGKIAFISRRSGTPQLYMMSPDGSDQVRLTAESQGATFAAWRP